MRLSTARRHGCFTSLLRNLAIASSTFPAFANLYRFAVESLTELLQHYPEKDVLKTVRLMKLFANHNQALTVATITKGLHPEPLLTELKHMADGVMEFNVERKGFGIYNYLIISKMRGISDATRLLLFKETDKGLWLESTRRVF